MPAATYARPALRCALSLTAATAVATTGVLVAAPATAAPAPASTLDWGPCESETSEGLECATVVVPRDHADPAGPTIEVGVYRLDLPDEQPRPAKVLFVNPGGPGGESGSLVQIAAQTYPADVLATHDVIGVDPRGLGISTHVSCFELPPEGEAPLPSPDRRPFPKQQFDALVAHGAELTAGCFERSPELVPFISTTQTAQDFDVVRAALGVERASFVGYSYGTVLFAHYARLFPQQVDKLVLDSAAYNRDWGWELYEDRAPAFEARLDLFAQWAADNAEIFALGDTQEEVLATYDRIIEELQDPEKAATFGIGPGDVQLLATQAAFTSQNFPLLGLVLSLADLLLEGDLPLEVGTAHLAELKLAAEVVPDDSSTATTFSVLCNDGPFPAELRTYERAARKAERHYPRIGSLQVAPFPCATWPLEPQRPLPVSSNKLEVPPLVVQALGDPATPYASGQDVARRTDGALLTVTGGDHGHFGLNFEPCVDAAVSAYLVDGVLPADGAVCEGAPLPSLELEAAASEQPVERMGALTSEVVARAGRTLHLTR